MLRSYLPESPEVRSKNVRGKYRERKSQKGTRTLPISPLATDTTDSGGQSQAMQPESPRYAEPQDALIPPTKTDDSQAVTTGVTNTVYAQVDLGSKRRKDDEKKGELEERRREEERQRAIQEALRKQEEAQRKQVQERQIADSRKQDEIRQKEEQARQKREEKKRRDDEVRRMKEIMKRDKKDRKKQGQIVKKRASTGGRGYDLTFESDFGSAGLF